MDKIDTILSAANRASTELRERLGGDAASVALAVALGRLCAESGISVADAVAMVEITHREARLELDGAPSAAVA